MKDFSQLADKQTVDKTMNALALNGIDAKFVQTADEAKKEVLSLIPERSEVMTLTSNDLDSRGIAN